MNTNHSVMERLEAYLLSVASPRVLFFNDAPDRLHELSDEMLKLNEQMNNIQAKADAEQRSLTSEERDEIETMFARFEEAGEDLDRRERLLAIDERLRKSNGRRTDPDLPVNDPDAGADQNANRRQTIPARPRDAADAGRWGWGSIGQYAAAVKSAVRASPGNVDPRLVANAPTTFSTEGIGEDGGFAVPPDFRRDIMVKVAGEESLLSRTDQLTSSSNSITLPKDETTPHQTTGGVLAFWENEGALLTQSKIALEQETIRLNKLTALVPVTSELLEDAPAMSTYLRRKVPEKFTFKVNDAIVNGTGAGQPRGLLNSAALISVAKESGQAADTIVFNNITNMWSRLYSGCRSNAIWLVNQDIEPQLLGLQFPGSGTAVPVYLPPGGLSVSPFGTLMGKPVIPIESAQTLGDAGDIILTDLTQYLTALKTGGIRQDVSMHLWFDYDQVAFRFIMRVAGQSWWSSAISPANGSNTRSCTVSLAERA